MDEAMREIKVKILERRVKLVRDCNNVDVAPGSAQL